MDVLVKWDKGGTNVFTSKGLQIIGDNQLEKGNKVKMMWYGVVERHSRRHKCSDDSSYPSSIPEKKHSISIVDPCFTIQINIQWLIKKKLKFEYKHTVRTSYK